jgi:hypothetical protein
MSKFWGFWPVRKSAGASEGLCVIQRSGVALVGRCEHTVGCPLGTLLGCSMLGMHELLCSPFVAFP